LQAITEPASRVGSAVPVAAAEATSGRLNHREAQWRQLMPLFSDLVDCAELSGRFRSQLGQTDDSLARVHSAQGKKSLFGDAKQILSLVRRRLRCQGKIEYPARMSDSPFSHN
jgi:hypothetical protein